MGIDPISLTFMAVTAAGAAVAASGASEAGQAGQTAANYQAAVAANNAKIANQNAAWDIQAGETAATNKGLQTRATVGSQKAQQAAAGIDTTTGSAADVRAGTEEIGMLDALTLRSNASRAAYSDEVKATSETAQSQLDIMQGEQAKQAGEIGAVSSLLSGVSSVGGKFAGWQKFNTTTPGGGGFTTGAP